MLKRTILLLVTIGCVYTGHTQLPGNWTVVPTDYNYSMTITSFIDENCNELTDNANAVGAFVGNQCRGYAFTDVDANGRKLGFVTVYSNLASGESVELRFFKASTSQEIIALDGVSFLTNSSVGTVAQPFSVTTNHRPSSISVTNLVVQENTSLGGFIGTCSAIDADASQTLTFSLPNGSLENNSFQITNPDLELNTALNFAIQNAYQIAIEVNDGQGCSLIDTFTVVVDDNAFPPVAENDTLTVFEDDTLQIDVLVNDTDFDNDIDTNSIQVISNPTNGLVSISNGLITYIPDSNYFGADSFVYSICDLTNTGVLCDTAIVFISVVSVPDAPIANKDSITTLEETLVAISVLSNDTDVENDIDNNSLQVVTGPSNGTITISAGMINYTPNPSFSGIDTLIYSICDLSIPAALCDTAFVYIYVMNVPDTPTDIVIDTLFVEEDNEPNHVISSIYTTDTDLPNDSFTYELVSGANDEDNAQFTITDNVLSINNKTIFDIKNTYQIRVRSTDSFGLFIEEPFTITVIDIEGNTIPLPAATYISTLRDGKNDFFSVNNVAIYKDFELTVFDQFGKTVYTTPSNYANDFDGTQNGEPLPTGAYYYVFKSENTTYSGNITIVN